MAAATKRDDNESISDELVSTVGCATPEPTVTSEDVLREHRPATDFITKHLTCFNCFTEDSKFADAVDEYAALCTGLAKFQKLTGIPETGVFNKATSEKLRQYHCHSHSQGLKENLLALKQKDNFTYCFDSYPDCLPIVEIRAAFVTAFQEWGGHSVPPIKFTEMPPRQQVDIRVDWRDSFGFEIGERMGYVSATTWGDKLVHVSHTPAPEQRLHAKICICFNEGADTLDMEWTIPLFQNIVFHQVGHILGLGHSETKDAAMWPMYENTTLHQDDIRAIKTKFLTDGDALPLRQPFKYDEWNQILEPHPGRVAEIVAAMGNKFYRRDTDGSVWQYSPIGTWEHLNDTLPAKQIDASSHYLYLLHQDNRILRYGENKSWEQIDSPSKHSKIIRAARNGKTLYQLYGERWVSSFSNEKDCQWILLDENTDATNKTVDIVATGSQVFFQHADGAIFVSNGAYKQCHRIQGACKAKQLIGSQNWLYRLAMDSPGQIFEWKGVGEDWVQMNRIFSDTLIAAAGSYLYLHFREGRFWYNDRHEKVLGSYATTDWKTVAKAEFGKIVQLAAADSSLYCLGEDGGIHLMTLRDVIVH